MDFRRHETAGLLLALATGTGNLVAESLVHRKTAFILVAVPLWLGWAMLRLRRDPGAWRAWGFRLDTWRASARAVTLFVAPAALLLLAAAPLLGHWPFPVGFWLVLGLYPVWAVAQQFLLCAVLTRGLAHWLPHRAIPPAAGGLFALAHLPDLPLVGLTLVAGTMFTALYQRRPNLWVQGIGHAVLGTLTYYAVLGRDPAAALLSGF